MPSNVLCPQLTRDLFAIAKFLFILKQNRDYCFTSLSLHSQNGQFLSRISILTHDIDMAILSVRLSVCDVPVFCENGLTYCHIFSPHGSPVILVS